jgi:hypothetical protein
MWIIKSVSTNIWSDGTYTIRSVNSPDFKSKLPRFFQNTLYPIQIRSASDTSFDVSDYLDRIDWWFRSRICFRCTPKYVWYIADIFSVYFGELRHCHRNFSTTNPVKLMEYSLKIQNLEVGFKLELHRGRNISAVIVVTMIAVPLMAVVGLIQ